MTVFDCGNGLHAPVCTGCSCECHNPEDQVTVYAVHLEQDGRPLCNSPGVRELTADRELVTCKSCLRERQPCGTRGAYLRHLNHGEDPCPEDTAAALKYAADRKARREGRERLEAAAAEKYREAS